MRPLKSAVQVLESSIDVQSIYHHDHLLAPAEFQMKSYCLHVRQTDESRDHIPLIHRRQRRPMMLHRLSSVFLLFAGMFTAGRPPAIRVCRGAALLCNHVCLCVRDGEAASVPNHSSMIITFILRYDGEQMLRVLGCQATARQLLLSYSRTVLSPVRVGRARRSLSNRWESNWDEPCLFTACTHLLRRTHVSFPAVRGQRMNSTGGERR